jgi:hypothetical protein
LYAFETVIRDTPTASAIVASVGCLSVLAFIFTGKDYTGKAALVKA